MQSVFLLEFLSRKIKIINAENSLKNKIITMIMWNIVITKVVIFNVNVNDCLIIIW